MAYSVSSPFEALLPLTLTATGLMNADNKHAFFPMQCVQIRLELGHRATLRNKKTTQGFTQDWEVFIRGPEGTNIQNFVEKVVFYLHKDFLKPKRGK